VLFVSLSAQPLGIPCYRQAAAAASHQPATARMGLYTGAAQLQKDCSPREGICLLLKYETN